MVEHRDVVIIGAGLMGTAAAAALATSGRDGVLLEQFDLDHVRGSSHGSARIVRRGYGDELYTRLTGRAFELWREVELASGTSLLRILGGVDFGERRNVESVAAHLAANQVPHELLDAAESQRRWPGMLFDGPVVYHPQAGSLDAHAAVVAMARLAERRGVDVRLGTGASTLAIDGDEAVITTSHGEQLRARCVVVAAGGWGPGLLDGVLALPLMRVTRQQILHFPRFDAEAPPWPSVIHEDAAHGYYHLAGGRDGGPGDDRKIGEHDAGPVVDPDAPDPGPDPATRDRVIDYVRHWLPGLDPTPRGEASCLYTRTPNEDFVLDRVGPIVVCSPCSGHGAKFAPLIGELAIGLATGAGDVPDRFRLATHALGRTGAASL
jgi:sarcosine oxidase